MRRSGDRVGGAVLGITASADVGEYRREALEGGAASALALHHDLFVGYAHEAEIRIKVVDRAGSITTDLHQCGGDGFADNNFQSIGCRQWVSTAGRLENDLIADLLADATGDRCNLDLGELFGNVGAADGGGAVKRAETRVRATGYKGAGQDECDKYARTPGAA